MHPHHHDHHQHTGIKNIRLAFLLNLGFTIIELIGGVLTNSTAILADAVHDLGDSFALGQAWYFERLAGREGNNRYTYGFRRFSILGALISTLLLILSSFYILSEAVPRLLAPEPSHAEGMVVLALIGILVNGYAMLRLSGGGSMNVRTVGLHLLEDVLGWVAILIVAVVLLFKDLYILDPILAILITVYILSNVIKNVKAIIPIFMQAAPEQYDVEAIRREIEEIQHVQSAHHIHIWSLDDRHQVFSVHLVANKNLDARQYAEVKQTVKDCMHKHGFFHSTVEIELPEESCRMAQDEPHP